MHEPSNSYRRAKTGSMKVSSTATAVLLEGFQWRDAVVETHESLDDQFPTIAEACEQLPADTLLDGELIALDKNGHVSFNMLQHHRSQAQAILFYAFDVIIH